jgi:hypothetical protein
VDGMLLQNVPATRKFSTAGHGKSQTSSMREMALIRSVAARLLKSLLKAVLPCDGSPASLKQSKYLTMYAPSGSSEGAATPVFAA